MLSTISGTDFNDFYTEATRLIDQTAQGTFGEQVAVRNTQVLTYVPLITSTSNDINFVYEFIDKYTQLATQQNQPQLYTHVFDAS